MQANFCSLFVSVLTQIVNFRSPVQSISLLPFKRIWRINRLRKGLRQPFFYLHLTHNKRREFSVIKEEICRPLCYQKCFQYGPGT